MCKKHSIADRFLVGDDCTGKKCRICRHIVARNNYLANKEAIQKKQEKYRKENPEKVNQAKKLSRLRDVLINKRVDLKRLEGYNMLRKLLCEIAEIERKYTNY